jgi:hypothetical protein
MLSMHVIAVQLEWMDRRRLFQGSPEAVPQSSRRGKLSQLVSAHMHEGSPVLLLAHIAVNAALGYAEIRPALIDLVDVTDLGLLQPDGTPLRAVALHDVAPQQLATAIPCMAQLVVRFRCF